MSDLYVYANVGRAVVCPVSGHVIVYSNIVPPRAGVSVPACTVARLDRSSTLARVATSIASTARLSAKVIEGPTAGRPRPADLS